MHVTGRRVAFSGLPRTMNCLARRVRRVQRVITTLRPRTSSSGRHLVRVSRTYGVAQGTGPAVCALTHGKLVPTCGQKGGLCFCRSRLLR